MFKNNTLFILNCFILDNRRLYHVMRAVLKENHELCQNESRLSLLKEYDGILLNITW